MSTVASIWRSERQDQNAQQIARLAGQLLDKITASLGDFDLAGRKMGDAVTAQNNAIKRLSTGRGNALSLGERILDLGVKAKPMPPALIDGVGSPQKRRTLSWNSPRQSQMGSSQR